MFAVVWIIVWALIFGIFNDPDSSDVIWFIIIGIGGPVGKWLINTFND